MGIRAARIASFAAVESVAFQHSHAIASNQTILFTGFLHQWRIITYFLKKIESFSETWQDPLSLAAKICQELTLLRNAHRRKRSCCYCFKYGKLAAFESFLSTIVKTFEVWSFAGICSKAYFEFVGYSHPPHPLSWRQIYSDKRQSSDHDSCTKTREPFLSSRQMSRLVMECASLIANASHERDSLIYRNSDHK